MYFESRCEHHVAHHVAQFCVEIEYLTASLGCSQIHHFLPLTLNVMTPVTAKIHVHGFRNSSIV